eukprot:GFUD01095213.1.p1 GENE.GFUD01095213.1~~GFUD01095213.1.p1  ORF type:complete len:201 (-),score=58.67 GFUD01095213.1:36-638(-)
MDSYQMAQPPITLRVLPSCVPMWGTMPGPCSPSTRFGTETFTSKYQAFESSSPKMASVTTNKGANLRTPGKSSNRFASCESSTSKKWTQLVTAVGKVSFSYCRFCQNNGETEEIFLSHVTKESSGAVQCPILRSYTCPVCGQTGDRAHTVSYCPRNRTGGSGLGDRKTGRGEGRRSDKENDPPAIPTPMAGHLLNINNKK